MGSHCVTEIDKVVCTPVCFLCVTVRAWGQTTPGSAEAPGGVEKPIPSGERYLDLNPALL